MWCAHECCKLKPPQSLSVAAPKVIITPSSPRAMRNHSLLLQCSSNSSRVPTFTWKKGSVELNSDAQFSITSDGSNSSLYIDRFNDVFLGEYSCMASDEVHGSAETSVEIQLSTEIYLLRPLKNQTEFEGTPLEVECAIDGGVGNLTMEWRKDNSVLHVQSLPGVTVCTESSCGPHPSIKFKELALSHEGNYSCVVNDSQKSKTFSFLVIVYSELHIMFGIYIREANTYFYSGFLSTGQIQVHSAGVGYSN